MLYFLKFILSFCFKSYCCLLRIWKVITCMQSVIITLWSSMNVMSNVLGQRLFARQSDTAGPMRACLAATILFIAASYTLLKILCTESEGKVVESGKRANICCCKESKFFFLNLPKLLELCLCV